MAKEKTQALLANKKSVQDQITKNAEVRMQQRLDYLEEGKKRRQQIEEERAKIARIQQDKVE